MEIFLKCCILTCFMHVLEGASLLIKLLASKSSSLESEFKIWVWLNNVACTTTSRKIRRKSLSRDVRFCMMD
jgi:hypothetical protein